MEVLQLLLEGFAIAFQPLNLAMVVFGCTIGLFIGAVITVLAYQLFMAWLAQTSDSASEAEESAAP